MDWTTCAADHTEYPTHEPAGPSRTLTPGDVLTLVGLLVLVATVAVFVVTVAIPLR